MALFNYECDEVKRIIEEVRPNYPQLTTYISEWLYLYENEYTPGTPVELEYHEVIVNPYGRVDNAIPHNYKSAILKGSTKYRDIDTLDILDTLDETKNLELVSVNMPVLTTTNCLNLFTKDNTVVDGEQDVFGDFVEAKKNDKFSFNEKYGYVAWTSLAIYNVNKEMIYYKYGDDRTIPKTIVL